MISCPIRVGVDIGSTFTDLVPEVSRAAFSPKILTTHAVPEDAIVEGAGVTRGASI